jgi:hypothetical protein
MLCFDKRACKDCRIYKDLNTINFELRDKRSGRMSLICKPCNRIKINIRNNEPERKQHLRDKNKKLKDWYRDYHKSPKAREKARLLRKRPDHRALRISLEAKRRASQLKRTPLWADLKAIGEFYKNCPKGMHVDHIIPLQGRIVSGFHILENLQYLTPEENSRKSNKF